MSTSLLELIEEFHKLMSTMTDLVEETRSEVNRLPDLAISEAPSRVNVISDLCAEGIKKFQEALSKAEEIQDTLR